MEQAETRDQGQKAGWFTRDQTDNTGQEHARLVIGRQSVKYCWKVVHEAEEQSARDAKETAKEGWGLNAGADCWE